MYYMEEQRFHQEAERLSNEMRNVRMRRTETLLFLYALLQRPELRLTAAEERALREALSTLWPAVEEEMSVDEFLRRAAVHLGHAWTQRLLWADLVGGAESAAFRRQLIPEQQPWR